MSTIKRNLISGIKSGLSITNETDRKLIDSMVRGNTIDYSASFDELVSAITGSHGKILKYLQQDKGSVYFDSTGKYISDYKSHSEQPNLDQLDFEVPERKQHTSMYRGVPVPSTHNTTSDSSKVKMYRGVPVN